MSHLHSHYRYITVVPACQDYSCERCGQRFPDLSAWTDHSEKSDGGGCGGDILPGIADSAATAAVDTDPAAAPTSGRFVCKKCRIRHSCPKTLRDSTGSCQGIYQQEDKKYKKIAKSCVLDPWRFGTDP